MFLRVLGDAFARQKRRKAIVFVAVALGTAAASAPADIALDVGDRMSRELKAFGANLVVVPRGAATPVRVGGADFAALSVPAYLRTDDVLRVKDNFWKNNILGFAPLLDAPAEIAAGGTKPDAAGDSSKTPRAAILRGAWFDRPFRLDGEQTGDGPAPTTGLRRLNPYWQVEGRWPGESGAGDEVLSAGGVGSEALNEALVGARLAAALGLKPGDRFDARVSAADGAAAPAAGSAAGMTVPLVVAGILTTGGDEEDMVLAPLETVQRAAGLEGRLSRVLVSALTTPESAVYERKGLDPRSLSPEEFESWSCTPFVSSIAFEIEETWPGAEARVVRRVADAEGAVLGRASGLMMLVAVMGLFGAALTVASALTAGVIERRVEIGLLKSLGARNATVIALFLAEAAVLGIAGGLVGSAAGAWLARVVSASIFGTPVAIRPASVPLAVACALVITLVGALLPVRRIAGFRPAEVLREAV